MVSQGGKIDIKERQKSSVVTVTKLFSVDGVVYRAMITSADSGGRGANLTASVVRRARCRPTARGGAQASPLNFTQDEHGCDPEGSAEAIPSQHYQHQPARYRKYDGGQYQK